MRRTHSTKTASNRTPAAPPVADGTEPEILSVDEVIARYDDEWILLRITEWDEDGWPSQGEVLAHSPDHDFIWEEAGRRPPDKATGEQHYIFMAHPRVRTGAEMMEALKTAWESDDWEARRLW